MRQHKIVKAVKYKTKMRSAYKASAPGSLMLMGEHAVLAGKMALVCAVDKRIYVTLAPRQDRIIKIISALHGEMETSIDNIKIVAPFNFVLAAINEEMERGEKHGCGFDLLIESDFSDRIGLGSSAAVTVATLAVLQLWRSEHCKRKISSKPKKRLDLQKLFLAARQVVRKVQGVASGADVAASVFGGVVAYRMESRVAPFMLQKLASFVPLRVIYSGKKVLTKKVILEVGKRQKQHHKVFAALYKAMEDCVRDAIIVIKNKNWIRLGELANIHQGLQDALGVNTPVLAQIIFALRASKGIYGAKISGAGMGDCVIGIMEGEQKQQGKKRIKHGDVAFEALEAKEIEVKVSNEGVVILIC